jgi:hypothetical protein
MCSRICIPPISSLPCKSACNIKDHLSVGALNDLKFLGNFLQLVVGIQRIGGLGVGRRVVAHKLLMLVPRLWRRWRRGCLLVLLSL